MSADKHYLGTKDGNVFVVEGAARRPLPLRLDLVNHSPTGFAWGYCGSGPAQLALAIPADATGDDDLAVRLLDILPSLKEGDSRQLAYADAGRGRIAAASGSCFTGRPMPFPSTGIEVA